MKLALAGVATTALLIKLARGEDAVLTQPSRACTDHPHHHHDAWTTTVTLEPETVCSTSTSTVLKTITVDGVVRLTTTTNVLSTRTTTTRTQTITTYSPTVTTTKTIVRTRTIRAPWGFVPAADTVFGFDSKEKWGKRDVAALEAAEDKKAESGQIDWTPEHKPKCGCNTCHKGHDHHDHWEREVMTVYVTPYPVTKKIATVTKTKLTKYVPTTVSITKSTSRTQTVVSYITHSTQVTKPTTVTTITTSTFTYYAACATNNIISHGPEGNTITNVFNNGRHLSSTYDVAEGTFRSPYECCVACQRSGTCTGSVFRTGEDFCLLLHRKDRKCGAHCENEAQYVTDPKSREAGLVISNGPCGYQRFGGHAKPGVPPAGSKPFAGRVRVEGLALIDAA